MSRQARLVDLVQGTEEPAERPGARGRVLIVVALVFLLAAFAAYLVVPRSSLLIPAAAPTSPATTPRYSRPVEELMAYEAALKSGRVKFDPALTGDEAARQLGYSTIFATAYGSLLQVASTGGPRALETELRRIIEEEQTIDWMMARRALITAIAVLRAIQNGEVAFPGPHDAPPARKVIEELAKARPEAHVDPNDAIFAKIYDDLLRYESSKIEHGALSVFDIVAELRRAIIKSVAQDGGGQDAP